MIVDREIISSHPSEYIGHLMPYGDHSWYNTKSMVAQTSPDRKHFISRLARVGTLSPFSSMESHDCCIAPHGVSCGPSNSGPPETT
jgi:hypothetical protein